MKSIETKSGYYVHVHLVSDATGETLAGIFRAACAQFRQLMPLEHNHVLTRSEKQLEQVLKDIEAAPGVVLYTMVNENQRDRLADFCARRALPCIDVLGPVLQTMSQYLGAPASHETSAQHIQDEAYDQRIDALNFAMGHDDGQTDGRIEQAEIVLVGVSRTSKTPTCVYLANRGIKAANIPLVPGAELPKALTGEKVRPLIVGLTISPRRLVQIRRNRLLSLNEHMPSRYIDEQTVRDEVIFAKRLFARQNWPVIDVTRRSIEETAAKIMALAVSRKTSDRLDQAGPV